MRWNLIHKFLSDQCTEAERKEVQQWLSEDLDRERFLNSIRKIWEVNPREEDHAEVKKAWNRFRAERMESSRVLQSKRFNRSDNVVNFRSREALKWYQKTPIYAAAAVVLLLAIILIVERTQWKQSSKITYQQVVTAKGEKISLKLNDGTRVKLNSETELKIPSNYGENSRTLYLQGEAFFNVKHQASQPFKVYAGGIYTKDIGTKFNIRAFPEDSTVAVVVAKGKVALGNANNEKENSVFLSTNERAIVLGARKPEIRQVTDLSSYIGWTKGKLVFDNTPFKTVMKQLERWYGVRCLVKNDRLLYQKLTATFENEPLPNVLKLLSKSMDIDARRKGQTVVFSVR